MENTEFISVKIYLIQDDSGVLEIRRCRLATETVFLYDYFVESVVNVFPTLIGKKFKIYWKDEDGDEVAASSSEELKIALISMAKSVVKKFYVKTQTPRKEEGVVRPGLICAGCGIEIANCRYKCIICKDYDLCSSCERANIHAEHPILRIINPLYYDIPSVQRVVDFLDTICPMNIDIIRQRRRHSHDGHREDLKKKRSDKRESAPEIGNESEDGWYKEHSCKKFKKHNKCLYGHLSALATYLNPIKFQPSQDGGDTAEELSKKLQQDFSTVDYLALIGDMKFQNLLDPLGMRVGLEARPKKKEKKNDDKKKEKKEKKSEEEEQTSESTVVGSPEKEVLLDETPDSINQKTEEVSKILANQTLNNKENDGWVWYEEL